nr:MAG TPA: hypothetical protein [Bacteriophage sp.]DAS47847.1 MAG TPA: hypothetical protein [Caudoviricetes sp.]
MGSLRPRLNPGVQHRSCSTIVLTPTVDFTIKIPKLLDS